MGSLHSVTLFPENTAPFLLGRHTFITFVRLILITPSYLLCWRYTLTQCNFIGYSKHSYMAHPLINQYSYKMYHSYHTPPVFLVHSLWSLCTTTLNTARHGLHKAHSGTASESVDKESNDDCCCDSTFHRKCYKTGYREAPVFLETPHQK